jgi:hypothetical protein
MPKTRKDCSPHKVFLGPHLAHTQVLAQFDCRRVGSVGSDAVNVLALCFGWMETRSSENCDAGNAVKAI